jgi:signal transduction histidine kinase
LAKAEATGPSRPKIFRSARVRILAWILLPVFVMLGASVGGAWYLLGSDLDQRLDSHLSREARELEVLAQGSLNPKTGEPFLTARELLEQFIQRTITDPGETMFVLVNGTVTARTNDEPPLRLDLDLQFIEQLNSATVPSFGDLETSAGKVRYHVVPVNSETDSGALVAAFFVSDSANEVNNLVLQFAEISLALFLASAGLGWWITGRVLDPVRKLRETAHAIGESDLTRRIDIGKSSGDEFGALASEFNEMLNRIETSFISQKQFVDDAGHELRTPLTIVRGHLDLIQHDPAQATSSLPIIRDEVLRMSRLVQDLQTLTKSNQPGFIRTERTNLFDLCDELFVKANALADRDWRVEHPARNAFANIDRQRVTQAVLQLCENASRHTQVGDIVELTCQVTRDSVTFAVADAGVGIPEAERERILLRFARGSDQDADSAGSGLGLAVVSAIADGHGGSVLIRDSIHGGAEVALVLPLNLSTQNERLT